MDEPCGAELTLFNTKTAQTGQNHGQHTCKWHHPTDHCILLQAQSVEQCGDAGKALGWAGIWIYSPASL